VNRVVVTGDDTLRRFQIRKTVQLLRSVQSFRVKPIQKHPGSKFKVDSHKTQLAVDRIFKS
jgi:hypothetical protein